MTFLLYVYFFSFALNRIPKSPRKLSKEGEKEKERPPWRSSANAVAPKVNKKALLKARILDASRRALIAQKIGHIGTQTDIRPTLYRDRSIDVQRDLIKKIDKSFDTDGEITIKKEGAGGCK